MIIPLRRDATVMDLRLAIADTMRALIPKGALKVETDLEALFILAQELPLWVNPLDARRGGDQAQVECLATITGVALSPQDARNQRVDIALRPNPKSDDGPGHGFASVVFFIAGSLRNMLVSGNGHVVRHTPSVERCDKAQQRRYASLEVSYLDIQCPCSLQKGSGASRIHLEAVF
jgi:hypothetical protein